MGKSVSKKTIEKIKIYLQKHGIKSESNSGQVKDIKPKPQANK